MVLNAAVRGALPPTGDIRGGEYPVAFARALNKQPQ